jgi:hypothetical protein
LSSLAAAVEAEVHRVMAVLAVEETAAVAVVLVDIGHQSKESFQEQAHQLNLLKELLLARLI